MGARKPKSHLITITICLILVLSLTGCLVASPEIVPEYTVPPISTGPVSTVEASPTLEPTPTGAIVVYDEFGNLVTSGDHFIRYLTISDVSVYERGYFSRCNGDKLVSTGYNVFCCRQIL